MVLFDYIDKYGDIPYALEKFNNMDNLVYATLSYIKFTDIVSNDRKTIKLQDAAELFLRTYTLKEYSKFGIIFKDAYRMIEKIKNKNRYKNNLLYNYEYFGDKSYQFSALCIRYNPTNIYISFEGTDQLMSGWKEDCELMYSFPVKCQKRAIEYIDKAIKPFDFGITIGGHSKGGNLAMVAGMYCSNINFKKIKRIYNNDGPWFIRDQFNSPEFERMHKKLITIIPNRSIVGLMLNHPDDYIVVESTRRDVFAHSPYTWKCDGTRLHTTSLSRMSRGIDASIRKWLLDHSYEQRKKMITEFFNALDNSGVDNITDLKQIKNIIKMIKGLTSLDKESKQLLINFVKFNVAYNLQYMLKK